MNNIVRHLKHHSRSLPCIRSQIHRSKTNCDSQIVLRTQRWLSIEITKTESSKQSTSSTCGSTATESKLKKTNQQQVEEELMTLNSHVKQHYQHANFTEALNVSNEVLEKSMDLFGQNHPAIASAYNNIGLMKKMMGDFEEARKNYHKALNIYQDIVGKDHASYAAALSNLGSLDRAQSVTDENLSSLERMQLNESAIEYFEESWKIRKAELGNEHPQTIMSQSNLGGAIAAQVLQGELYRQKQPRKESENNDNHLQMDKMSKFSKQKWDLAEQNLRAALQTAVKNPTGQQIQISNDKLNSSLPPRRDNTLSRKEKQKASKLRRKLEKQASQEKIDDDKSVGSRFGMGNTSIRTLTAAAAAQNLAVFLKSRADLISYATQNSKDANFKDHSVNSGDLYAEAKNLYLGALHVRTKLRGEHHPDTISTKFSLAELIDAIGDEAGANELRQELLDAYEVEERDMNSVPSEKI